MNWTRRDFLKAGATASVGLSFDLWAPWLVRQRLQAAPLEQDTKLIFIFQRGGNDGVNTVIPHGDPEYNVINRPTLYIPQSTSIELGNGFAGLHPRMDPMMEIYNHRLINGTDGPGNLAVIHRVGYPNQSQSHFNSQQYWENGAPGNPTLEEGMIYRLVALTMNPDVNHLLASAISSSQMVALKGQIPMPTIRDPESFIFSGSDAEVQKLIGQAPTSPQGGDGTGLLGAYGGTRDFAEKDYRDLVYGTGMTLIDAMRIVQNAVDQGPYTPINGAVYPENSFGAKLAHAAMLLKRTPVRVLGLNIGGWDTHSKQGQVNGRHGDLLGDVAQGFQALYRDLQEQWDKLIIVTMTEFGRTSRENGSLGTDHAYACVMFVAGGHVNGGVYNCDVTTWAEGDLFSARDRYVQRKTDYRTIFAEIFQRHFGDSPLLLDEIIPGYSQAVLDYPEEFAPLGLLS